MKIIKMKELAAQFNFKNAKNFKTTETYLEYVINEINLIQNLGKFHQFLFLIDVLYVIIDDGRAAIPLTTMNEINSHYIHHTMPFEKDTRLDSEDLADFEKNEKNKRKITPTKASVSTEEVDNTEINSNNLFSHKLKWK